MSDSSKNDWTAQQVIMALGIGGFIAIIALVFGPSLVDQASKAHSSLMGNEEKACMISESDTDASSIFCPKEHAPGQAPTASMVDSPLGAVGPTPRRSYVDAPSGAVPRKP